MRTSSVAACRNAWGGKNSLRSNIMPPVSNHCSAARCASQRCPPAVGGDLPFAMRRRIDSNFNEFKMSVNFIHQQEFHRLCRREKNQARTRGLGYTKKVLLYEEHDETPRIQDLRAPVLCNPPVLKTTRRRGPPLDIYIRALLGFR